MKLQEFLTADFLLTDGLSPSLSRELSIAAQALDTPPPRHHPGVLAESLAAQQASRQDRMREAERIALELVIPSHYDLQVIVVALRAGLEVRGPQHCLLVLRLLAKLLGQPWEGLANEAASLPEPERKRVERKRARFVDAVLEQVFDVLARWGSLGGAATETPEHEDDEASASPAEWIAELSSFETQLEQRNLRPARWDALSERVKSLASAAVAADGPSPGTDRGPQGEIVAAEDRDTDDNSAQSSFPTPGERHRVPDTAKRMNQTGTVELRVSPRFWDLVERLEAFGWCLRQQEFEKAALVAKDLEGRLAAFDAPSYFPELFADYFTGLASYANQLEPHMAGGHSVRAQSLTRLYHSDLPRFLQADSAAQSLGRTTVGVP